MKTLLKLVLALALVMTTMGSKEAEAQYYPRPNHSYYVYNGVYTGWGYYPIVAGYWPWTYYNYPAWQPYGYSYWGYWNYQPYYSTFGAISYSPATDRVGFSYGTGNATAAMQMSNAYCGQGDCAPAVWVQGGCAALTKNLATNHIFWAYHTTRAWAETYALNACRREAGAACEIKAWVCSW